MKSYYLKNSLTAVFLLAATIIFSSCDKETLRGHGDVISATRTVGAFDKIEVGGEFEVYLTQGEAKEIVLEGQENVLADVRSITRNNKLKIDFGSCRVKIKDRVRVYITTPHLSEVSVSGSNIVRGLTHWQVNDFSLKTSGSGSVDLTLLGANEVESRISGSGTITLYGQARRQHLDISGSGRLHAFDFYTQATEVKISGSGKSDVRASEELKATISGSGTVRFKGSPSVNSSVSGSGKVYPAG